MLEVLSINRSLALKWHRQIGVSKRTNYGIVLKFKNTFLKSSFAFTEKLSRVEFSYGPCSAIAALSSPNTHPHTHKYSEPSLPHYPVNIPPQSCIWLYSMNLYWHIMITKSPEFTLGSLLALYILWVWTSVSHHYCITQNSFCIKNPMLCQFITPYPSHPRLLPFLECHR